MSGLTDLQAAMASLTTAVSNAAAELASLASDLSAANAAGGDPDSQIETIAQSAAGLATTLQNAVATATPPATSGT